jgi:hypothetical protein
MYLLAGEQAAVSFQERLAGKGAAHGGFVSVLVVHVLLEERA